MGGILPRLTARAERVSVASVWIYLLVGLAVGLGALIVVTFARERRYRLLFSDTHLAALLEALGAARTAPAKTFAGVALEWRPLKLHVALVLRASPALAPEAARFLMGVMAHAVGRTPEAALVLAGGGWALVFPGALPSEVAREPSDASRSAGVEAMRGLAVVPGALAAWE